VREKETVASSNSGFSSNTVLLIWGGLVGSLNKDNDRKPWTFMLWNKVKSSYSTKAKQVTFMQRGPSRQQKDNAAAGLCFRNYLAFLRPAADRAVPILPWVVSRGRSYRYLWADSVIKIYVRKEDPTPAYWPVSDW
jgi:hypothetical protein